MLSGLRPRGRGICISSQLIEPGMQPTLLRGAESEGATAAVHLSVGQFLVLADRLIRIRSYPTPGLCPLLIQELPPTKAGDPQVAVASIGMRWGGHF